MKRLAVLVLWVLASLPARAEMDRAVLLSLAASVLKVEALRVQGGFSLGSGVVIAPERVVTNCHVTRDALKINVLRGGARWLASSQLSDLDHDLCLLRVPGLGADAVMLGRAERLKRGQPVTALGYTGGVGMQPSVGEVLALHRFDNSAVIQSSNWFSSGASGGGLFDEDHQLVGVLTFRLRGAEAHYFAAPVEWVRAMLDAGDPAAESSVAPDRSAHLAYWERTVHEQPRFLRAALLQRNGKWPELESLAQEWASADATDSEPWYWMGLALAQMNRMSEAHHALGCGLAMDPDPATRPARLEPVYGRAGGSDVASRLESGPGNSPLPPERTTLLADAGVSASCGLDAVAPRTP